MPRSSLHLIACAALILALGLTGCDSANFVSEDATSQTATAGPQPAQIGDDAIPGQYIVVFKDDARNVRGLAQRLARAQGGEAFFTYEHTIKGFAFRGSDRAAAALERNPNVAYVQPDRVVTLAPPCGTPNGGPCDDPGDGDGGGDGGSTQFLPYGITMVNGGVSGVGERACVIDSGIDLDHEDLTVDVNASRSFLGGRDANNPDDQNGHGTHVAGTIAAKDNNVGVIGVAAGATVVSIRVLDRRGSGSYSGVIAGVDYVGSGTPNCDVANMSLGGPADTAMDEAVLSAASAVTFVLAAGNESDDARNHSPARAGGASPNDRVYTISAVDSNKRFASFSNYGPAVAYAAPGVSVQSTYKNGGYASLSGTSMAAPHAAGVFLLGNALTNGSATNDPDNNPDPIISH